MGLLQSAGQVKESSFEGLSLKISKKIQIKCDRKMIIEKHIPSLTGGNVCITSLIAITKREETMLCITAVDDVVKFCCHQEAP